jgi:hypothetical protein
LSEENDNKQLIGLVGVHYFAAELARRSFVPVMTSRNTEGIDSHR